MNVNSLIISGLASLSIPVSANVYTGALQEYIVFNYSDERPALRADDTDINTETTIQVHYFTKGNPQTKKASIKTLLKAAGFTIISTQELYETDTQFIHVIVTCWIEE